MYEANNPLNQLVRHLGIPTGTLDLRSEVAHIGRSERDEAFQQGALRGRGDPLDSERRVN
jgi:hypothetical protein